MSVPWPSRAAVFDLAAPLIERFEGFNARPYADAGGIWTIGFGTTHYPNGQAVTKDDPPCSPTEARVYLEDAMGRTLAALVPVVDRAPTVHQAAAILSLAYNIGVGAFSRSTVLAAFNAGDMAGAAAHFADWNKVRVGGVPVALVGLCARRMAEAALFRMPDAAPRRADA